MTDNFVANLIAYILKIVVALGVSLIIWTLVVGTDGLGGPSVLKKGVWNGVSTAYSTLIVEKTDNYGYGYDTRTAIVWSNGDGDAKIVQDTQSPQA